MSCGITNPYMNNRAEKGQPYNPTTIEHVANTLSHGIAIIPSILISKHLLDISYRDLQFNVMLIYGVFTTFLFISSTIYHFCELVYRPDKRKLRYYLHIIDRAAIYFFIAASSTPWLTLRHSDILGTNLKWIVWAFAFFGIAYQLKFHEKYKTVETCLYIVIAFVPYMAIINMNDRNGLPLMICGGVVYIIGVVFFKMDGIIPFAHSIWHCHVLLGSVIHTYAVYTSLLGPDKLNPYPDVSNID